ncbi:MAG: hypothetical protein GY861_12885 [bacterium]|nr:hypothetical protein [bacterium]
MARKYADPAGGNSAPYENWGDAATSLQTVLDIQTAGEEIWARGTFNEDIDVDTNSGDTVNGMIFVVGCNAGGTVDGTRAKIDGQSARASCLQNYDQNYIWWENWEFTGATGDGVDLSSGGNYGMWINCVSHTNGTHGWDVTTGADYHIWIRCQTYLCDYGWSAPGADSRWFGCTCYSNTDGMISSAFEDHWVAINCAITDNGDGDPMITMDSFCVIYNCDIDSSSQTTATGWYSRGGGWSLVLANRITNFTGVGGVGLDANSDLMFHGWNLYDNNTDDTDNDTLLTAIPADADTDTNEYDPDVDDGYNNAGNRDLNKKASRTYNGDGTDTLGLNMGS